MMIRLFLITTICVTALLAENDCQDRILKGTTKEHSVRDTSCDEFVLKKGGDLTANVKSEADIPIFNVWLYKCTGEIDETSFPTLRDQITKIQFSHCDVGHFALPDLPKLKEIEITDSKFPDLTADSLKNAPNLEEVIIRGGSGINMDLSVLKPLRKLKLLVLQDLNIPRLGKSSLEGLEDLEDLSLWNDNLETLDGDTFENSKKITRLSINEPKLTKIEPNTLKPLRNLNSLNLIKTNLEDFNVDYLSEQKELTSLGLPTKFLVNIGLEKLKEKLPKLEKIPIDEEDEDKEEMNEIRKVAEKLNIKVKGREVVID